MTDSGMGVTISAREIYDEIVGMRDDVRSLIQANESLVRTQEDHEQRLRGIERWKYSVPVAALAAVSSAVVTLAKGTGKA